MNRTLSLPIAAAALAALAAVTGCDRRDERTAGQKIDAGIAQVERSAERAGAEVKGTVADAAITASVNAQLARDSELSALKIDVDTSDGRVALRGSAPNRDARDRAARLASGVDGVKSVDNQLIVKG
ncbi:MAG: BON domain-containing protein [Rubrivivax sp.]|nr:BON domain-containing protein [Rubrivivax sp.]